MSRGEAGRVVILVAALGVICGLGVVQSASYLHDFIGHPTGPAVMYLVTLGCGAVAGWAVPTARAALLLPLAIVLEGGLVFFAVAYSPVWFGGVPGDVAVVNDLTRQVILLVAINAFACYLGAIAGLIADVVAHS
ncbi:MAG TPA: hypothetical protein VFW96_07860 [Thermomicrobiales bacterium]|nr:hypothetical protein [Thermomicrobiales bacterium]